MKKINYLNPFGRMCVSMGMIPSTYKESLTYEEQLLWFCKYLEDTVIPTVNNNADATEELQNLYNEIKTYVDEYFDNLDVQEEINNKLDAMVENGSLAEVINQEIFDDLNNQIEYLSTTNTLIIGDSYALGTDDQGLETLTSWADRLKTWIENENSDNSCQIIAESGSSFLRAGVYNHTWLELLQSQINNITNKNLIKNIIVCGGYNDKDYSITNLRTAITSFVNYCYEQFPNALVYLGCIGYRYEISSNGASIRANIAKKVYPAYANNVSSNILSRPYVYLNGVENILKSIPKTYMYLENPHPTQAGQNVLAQGIYQAFKTGSVSSYSEGNITLTNSNASSVSATIPVIHTGSSLEIDINSLTVNFTEESAVNLPVNTTFELGDYSVNNFVGGIDNINNTVVAYASITNYANQRYTVVGYLTFNILGKLTFTSWSTEGGASVQINTVKQISVYRTRALIPELLS